jgi:hypothetical protein
MGFNQSVRIIAIITLGFRKIFPSIFYSENRTTKFAKIFRNRKFSGSRCDPRRAMPRAALIAATLN